MINYGAGISYIDYSQEELYDNLQAKGFVRSYSDKVNLESEIGVGFDKIDDRLALNDMSAKLGLFFNESGSNFNLEYLCQDCFTSGTHSIISKNEVFIPLDSMPKFFENVGFDIGGKVNRNSIKTTYEVDVGVFSKLKDVGKLGIGIKFGSDGKPQTYAGFKWNF